MARFTMFFEMLADLPVTAFAAKLTEIYQPFAAWVATLLAAFDFSDLAVAVMIYLFELALRSRRAERSSRLRGRARPRQPERITPTLSPLIGRSRPELSTTTTLS